MGLPRGIGASATQNSAFFNLTDVTQGAVVGKSFATTRVAVASNTTETVVVHKALLVGATLEKEALAVLTSAVRVLVTCHARTKLGDTETAVATFLVAFHVAMFVM